MQELFFFKNRLLINSNVGDTLNIFYRYSKYFFFLFANSVTLKADK